MSPTRQAVFTAITLVLWGAPYSAQSAERIQSSGTPAASQWPAENAISGVTVKPSMDGDWLLEFDCAFVGKPPAKFRVDLLMKSSTGEPVLRNMDKPFPVPKPGRHHFSTALSYTGTGTSTQIVVSLVPIGHESAALASHRVDQVIQWPTQDEMDVRYATNAIDNGSSAATEEAREKLELVIARNPNYAPAYIEMARVAMRTNWSPEGLHHAETLLDSALKLSPQSSDAKILLGYVYTHQRRFGEAEKQFTDAARSKPLNLWLWTNWGEMLDMQGKVDPAIAKYREAVTRPLGTGKSYRAKEMAYTFLLKRLQERKDADGLEALYTQRMREWGVASCYDLEYARFKLEMRGDARGAMDLARGALELNCRGGQARQILGLANYVLWAQGTASSAEALNQARIFLPPGPTALYLLARSDSAFVAAKKLVAAGTPIDQLDNEKMTALALALQDNELDAVERLLRLGARPETPVSYVEIPTALWPVTNGNLEAIRIMQRAGVDYSKLIYRGITAYEYAKQIGDKELLEVLKPGTLAL